MNKEVYKSSIADAIRHNEQPLWRQSHLLNCECAAAIENAITRNYSDNRLGYCAKEVIDKYGYERVMHVLANTVQLQHDDGRYLETNKEWADGIYVSNDDVRHQFLVNSHPGLTNLFINQVRDIWNSLGLYEKADCNKEDEYIGKVLVIKPEVLKDEYKSGENQLFYATSGFGCSPDKLGQKVFGFFLADGEKTSFRRSDFIGVIRPECIPTWAMEKIAYMNSEPEQSPIETQETELNL